MKVDVLIVGAGFAGSVIAERCASAGKTVLVIDKREHIAGNAFDELDRHGVLIHRYGPHIFHTNSLLVQEYLSRFTDWTPYEHRVLASVNGEHYPIPINQKTINKLYGLSLDEQGVASFLESVRVPRNPIQTSEDLVLNSVGTDLCDKFFRGYTRKQWGLDLSELSASVAGRIPVRTNTDDRYFGDAFQKMPTEGYTAMFRRMLTQPNIHLELLLWQIAVPVPEVRTRAPFSDCAVSISWNDQLSERLCLYSYYGIQTPDVPKASWDLNCSRISSGGRRSLLSNSARSESGTLSSL